jgi:probable rRNA maturation factor
VVIEVVDRQRLARVPTRKVASLAAAVLGEVRLDGASLTIAFVRDAVIRKLNRVYRRMDKATDVLSFPASEPGAAPGSDTWLGDIVISTDAAKRQAREARHALNRELSELVIHGALHLCGYDHETDSGEMNRLELRLRRKLLG